MSLQTVRLRSTRTFSVGYLAVRLMSLSTLPNCLLTELFSILTGVIVGGDGSRSKPLKPFKIIYSCSPMRWQMEGFFFFCACFSLVFFIQLLMILMLFCLISVVIMVHWETPWEKPVCCYLDKEICWICSASVCCTDASPGLQGGELAL